MIPGESQLNSDGETGRKAGIGRMKPTLKPSFDISCERIDARETSVSGAKYFLSFSLKSGTTV
jgi:hypothetical protein